MAKSAADVPPIPVPPVEPTPAAAVIPPLVDLAAGGTAEAPRPDPYAPASVNPYYQPSPPAGSPQPYGQQPYAYQPYQAGPPTGLSIASMVLGIAGIFFFFGLVSIAAIITGHLAQRSQPHARGFWLTGLITGYVGLGLGLLVIVIYVGYFVVLFGVLGSSGYSSY
jgi:hypothetical protein